MKNLFLLLTFLIFSIQSYAQWTDLIWDTITFEEPYEYITIDTSNQNIWQIGKPLKTFFNNAYSEDYAIITDSINFYPVNNYSYFDLHIGNFNIDWYPENIYIEIKHKFNTDTLKDGGFITISYDNGVTWMNIIKDTVYLDVTPQLESGNLYSSNDSLFNGEFGFSGNSNKWISTWFTWHITPVKSTTNLIGNIMIIRFNFISDNIETNKEGWMIDNIKLYSVDLGSSISDKQIPRFNIYPNPVGETSIIKLNNYQADINLSIFNIQGQLIKQENYYNKHSFILNRENISSGIYFIKISNDENILGVKKLILK